MNNPSGFGQYPLWDALYNNSISSPGPLFGDWTHTTFWQYTWQRSVPGITGVVDASYFHGSRTQLAALANDAVIPAVRPYGAIGAKWTALGGTSGFLGRPLNNEHDVAGVPGARMEDFTGGTIYWSPATGAHEVHGAILARYRATGNAAKYGLPVTDETKTPDGIGRYNHFTSGRSIYWTPTTSAHLVYGAIRRNGRRWAGNAAVLAIPPPMSTPLPAADATTSSTGPSSGHPGPGPSPYFTDSQGVSPDRVPGQECRRHPGPTTPSTANDLQQRPLRAPRVLFPPWGPLQFVDDVGEVCDDDADFVVAAVGGEPAELVQDLLVRLWRCDDAADVGCGRWAWGRRVAACAACRLRSIDLAMQSVWHPRPW